MSFFKLLMEKAALPALLGWTMVILYFTLIPAKYLVDAPWYNQDKLGHMVVFFGWTLLYLLHLHTLSSSTPAKMVFLFSLAFGFGIEVLQYLLPLNRSAELADFLADALGSGLSFPVFRWLKRRGFI